MALSAAFRERLGHMESTRNQRLSLLQAEKEAQANKSQVLAMKLASMRATEQRCLALDQKIASQSFRIWALRSEIDRFDEKYQSDSHQLRSNQALSNSKGVTDARIMVRQPQLRGESVAFS